MTNTFTITPATIEATPAEFTELSQAAVEAIERFNRLKLTIKELEAQKAAADAEIRMHLAGAQIGTVAGVERVRIVHRNTSKIDRALLQAAWPEAYEATIIESPYTIIQAK